MLESVNWPFSELDLIFPSFFTTTTMSSPIGIPGIERQVGASVSPTSTNIHDRFASVLRQESLNVRQPRVLHPVENEGLRLLILENISQEAVNAFKAEGLHVDHYTKALSEDELLEKIGFYHGIGIRSKTKITEKVIKAATKVRDRTRSREFDSLILWLGYLASRHWLLLYRHQSGRSTRCGGSWNTRLQLSIL